MAAPCSIGGVIIVCLVVPLQYYFGYQIIKNKVKNGPNVTERWAIIQVGGQGEQAGVVCGGVWGDDTRTGAAARLPAAPPAHLHLCPCF